MGGWGAWVVDHISVDLMTLWMKVRLSSLLGLSAIVRCGASYGKCAFLGAHERPSFCSGVTWNTSLPLAPAALDAAAKSDFELALDRLHKLGGASSMPLCLESWKALQCASKFQKCSSGVPTQKVRVLVDRTTRSGEFPAAMAPTSRPWPLVPTISFPPRVRVAGVPDALRPIC